MISQGNQETNFAMLIPTKEKPSTNAFASVSTFAKSLSMSCRSDEAKSSSMNFPSEQASSQVDALDSDQWTPRRSARSRTSVQDNVRSMLNSLPWDRSNSDVESLASSRRAVRKLCFGDSVASSSTDKKEERSKTFSLLRLVAPRERGNQSSSNEDVQSPTSSSEIENSKTDAFQTETRGFVANSIDPPVLPKASSIRSKLFARAPSNRRVVSVSNPTAPEDIKLSNDSNWRTSDGRVYTQYEFPDPNAYMDPSDLKEILEEMQADELEAADDACSECNHRQALHPPEQNRSMTNTRTWRTLNGRVYTQYDLPEPSAYLDEDELDEIMADFEDSFDDAECQ